MSVQVNDLFRKIANTIKVEVFETGFAELDSEWKQQDVCSPYSRLYYVISGQGYIRLHDPDSADSTLLVLNPGHIYLIPNGLSYDYFCEDHLEKVYIHVNLLLPSGLELFSGCRKPYQLPVSDRHLSQLKEWMISRRPEDAIFLLGEVYRAVAALLPLTDVGFKMTRQYSEMVNRLFSLLPTLKPTVSIQEISRIMNVSDSTLAKHFKKETDMSIGKYREQLLMNQARQFLASGKLSIGEIAEELGFRDQFYFSKYFKQRQRMTPSAYRNIYRN